MVNPYIEREFVNVESVKFDLTDCTLLEKNDDSRGWLNKTTAVAHLLRFTPSHVTWPFDLSDMEGANSFYRDQCCGNGGVMLSLDKTEADGREALCGLFKYRYQPGQTSMLYVGILWIPLQTCTFQLNVESVEVGTTGMREAAVMLLEGDAWSRSKEPPVVVSSADDFFQRVTSTPVIRLPSDDERFDHMFPEHPLSKVRARLNQVVDTLRFSASVHSMKPFKLN